MKRTLLVSAALLCPVPALAAPVYLSCQFPEDPRAPIELAADEANQTVNITEVAGKSSETYRAVFTKDQVIFQDKYGPYTLSRVTLDIVRGLSLTKSVQAGKCKLEPVPKRAF